MPAVRSRWTAAAASTPRRQAARACFTPAAVPSIDGKGGQAPAADPPNLGTARLRGDPGGGHRRDRRRSAPVLQKGRLSRVLRQAHHRKGRRTAVPVQRVRPQALGGAGVWTDPVRPGDDHAAARRALPLHEHEEHRRPPWEARRSADEGCRSAPSPCCGQSAALLRSQCIAQFAPDASDAWGAD